MNNEVLSPAFDNRIAELEDRITMLDHRLAALES